MAGVTNGPRVVNISKSDECSLVKGLVEQPLSEGDTWYLLDIHWFNQWKKYVDWDGSGESSSSHPGHTDNSSLIDYEHTNELKKFMTEDIDFYLISEPAWEKLVQLYNLAPGQKPIARKVVDHGMLTSYLRVEIYLVEVKLAKFPEVEKTVTKKFSKKETLANVEREIRKIFNIPGNRKISLSQKSRFNVYSDLSNETKTLQELSIMTSENLVAKVSNPSYFEPRESMKKNNGTQKPFHKPLDVDCQSTRRTLLDRAKHLLESGRFTDVEFLVGDNHGAREIIKAHKTLLVMSSPVFETMFYGSVPQPQPIVIPDMQPGAFNHLLQFIYTDVVNFESVGHANDLYYAADKYMLPYLAERCIQYVKGNVSPKNVFQALEFGILHENEALKEKGLVLLSRQMREAYKADKAGFDDLTESALLTIVQMEKMDMSELELFRAVVGWARCQCLKRNVEMTGTNMRQELNKTIGYIRFLAMTPEEFASFPARSGILTESESLAILINSLNKKENWPMPSNMLSVNRKARGNS